MVSAVSDVGRTASYPWIVMAAGTSVERIHTTISEPPDLEDIFDKIDEASVGLRRFAIADRIMSWGGIASDVAFRCALEETVLKPDALGVLRVREDDLRQAWATRIESTAECSAVDLCDPSLTLGYHLRCLRGTTRDALADSRRLARDLFGEGAHAIRYPSLRSPGDDALVIAADSVTSLPWQLASSHRIWDDDALMEHIRREVANRGGLWI